MPRYIDADKAVKRFEELHGNESNLLNMYNAEWIVSFIEILPTADVQKVRHGKWGKKSFCTGFFRCSECCAVWNRTFEYCPHCGAKMTEDKGNERV